jgi:hypothetical protein
MSTASGQPTGPSGDQPTEEELRAAYEAEIKKIRVEHVLLEHVVTLVNLGMRRTGLAPGTEAERDPEQVRIAIEGVRSQLALVEQVAPAQAGPIRDALSQLQLAYVRIGGTAAGGEEPGATEGGAGDATGGQDPQAAEAPSPPPSGSPPGQGTPDPDQPGPAQRSGRLWIPGQ